MTVWWLTVAILAASQVNDNLAQNYRYTPIGSPLETVCSNAPQTWTEMDNLCSKQFPGYRLLQRGYRERFDEVKAQDLDGLIPLRIKRLNNVVYWVNDFGLDNEVVGDEYLVDMQDNGPGLQEVYGDDEENNFFAGRRDPVFKRDASSDFIREFRRLTDENTMYDRETVGALNLANMRWRLVDENYPFATLRRHPRDAGDDGEGAAGLGVVCAVCEMLPRRDVRSPVYGGQNAVVAAREAAGDIYRVTLRCLDETPRGNGREIVAPKRGVASSSRSRLVDVSLLRDALADILDTSREDIEVEASPPRPLTEGNKDIRFLMLLSPRDKDLLINRRLLRDAYKVTGVDNLSVCAAENTTQPPITWPETDPGNVVVKSKLDKIVTSRECVQTENGVQWMKPVTWKVSIDETGSEVDERHSLETRSDNQDLSDILHRLARFKLTHTKPGGLHAVDEILGNGDRFRVYKAGDIRGGCGRGSKPRTLRETAEFIHNLARVPVKSRYLDVVVEELNRILQLDRANLSTLGNNPTRLAQDLEQIVTNMVLESGHDTMSVVKSDVALLVADVDSAKNPLSGVSLITDGQDGSKVNLREIRDEDDNAEDAKFSSEVSTVLPRSLITASKRVAFTIFSDDKLFQGNKSDPFVLQSRVVNVAVDGNPNFPLGDGEFVEISFKSDNDSSSSPRSKRCVFWNFATKAWSTEGCTLASTNERDVCRCNHLTHFALLVVPHRRHYKLDHSLTLHRISIVCSCFSLIGLVSITVTLMFFRNWHQEVDSLIVMNLSTAMAFNIIVYLVTAILRPKHMHLRCVVLGALLHYSVLVCFCWMFVIATLQVICLFTSKGAGGISCLLCKTLVFAWGLPLIPVVILLATDPRAYKYQSDRQFCYPHGKAFYETVLGPIAVIITLNAIAFVLVVCNIYSCCCWRDGYRPKYVIEEVGAIRRFKTTIFLFFLFGLPWSFGFFAHSGKVFAYIFCFTATLQGFVLCAFIVIIEGHTRVLWRRKMFGM